MSIYDIDNPYKYGNNWYIFPNTILSNLNLDDCNDTVNGVCNNTKTLSECIDICTNDPNHVCDGGYFIEAHDMNFCVPLRSMASEPSYPYYRFRNKSIYPELDNLKTTSFINRKKFPYPPKLANRLFYFDNLIVKNVETGLQIGVNDNNKMTETVVLKKDNFINIQLVPSRGSHSEIEQYIMVKNGDSVSVNIPKTAFILRQNDDGQTIEWLMRSNVVNSPNNTFMLFSKDPNKKIGEPLNYSEQFYLVSQENGTLFVNKSLNRLQTVNKNRIDAEKDGYNIYFKLIPNVEVYYCKNNECVSTNLKNSKMDGDTATVDSKTVARSPSCWGQCKTGKKTLDWRFWILVTLIIVTTILVVILNKNS